MDWDFGRLGEIPHFTSLQLTRSYYGLGSFTMQLHSRSAGAKELLPGRVAFLSDAPHKAVLIDKIVSKDGKITASGKPIKGIAARKLCVPPTMDDGHFGWDRFIGSAEAAYHHYAAANLYDPEDAKRKIPRLIAAQNRDRGIVLPWQSRFGTLDALLGDIGKVTGMGWDIVPDFANKQYIFTAWEGRDLTGGAGKVILSEGNRNTGRIGYTHDTSAQKNTAYVGGAGEDENRLIISEGNENAGLDRRETWVDAGSVYEMDMLKTAARKQLEAATEKKTFSCPLLDKGLCRYERDYDVGDLLIVSGDGVRAHSRLLEVRESYENGSRKLDASFGDEPVTITSMLREFVPVPVR